MLLAAAVGLTVWLLLPGRPRLPPSARPRVGRGGLTMPRIVPGAALAATAGALLTVVDGTFLALCLIGVGAVAGSWSMARRARTRRAAGERADLVVEVCEALAGELRAGQPPLTALRHCVEVWPALEPVAAAAELGGDVPRAMRRLAALPGASGLAEVAAAWQVSQSSGGAMATAVARVADASRRRRATRQLVASELSSAQATARLVAVLPVVVLAMGSGLGGDPWQFLLATPVGLTCLGLGLLSAYVGLAWIEKIATAAVDR